MIQLLRAFVDIALLRRDPGVLPASGLLLGMALVADAAAVAWQASVAFGPAQLAARVAAHMGFAVAAVWMLLILRDRQHRLQQTLTALFGTGALLAPLVVVLLATQAAAAKSGALGLLAGFVSLGVAVWGVMIVAHILRSAIDTSMFNGVAIALALSLADRLIARSLFPAGLAVPA